MASSSVNVPASSPWYGEMMYYIIDVGLPSMETGICISLVLSMPSLATTHMIIGRVTFLHIIGNMPRFAGT